MSGTGQDLTALRKLCPAAELWSEGGRPVVFLPGLRIYVRGGRTEVRDALLCPWEHSGGYSTRLFLSAAIDGVPEAKNWTSHNLQGRPWTVCSWNGVPADLPWIEILANHLRAFR